MISRSRSAIDAANRHEGLDGLLPNELNFRRLVATVTPRQVLCGNESNGAKGVYEHQRRAVALRDYTHYQTHTEKWMPVLALDVDDRDPMDLIMGGRQLPLPSWLVYNTRNNHAHAVYALKEPVALGPNGRQLPIDLAQLVRDALKLALSADPSHHNGITRTPWHPRHSFQPVLHKRWSLRELYDLLPTEVSEVKRQRRQRYHAPQASLDSLFTGRNDDLYRRVVHWCMDEARAGRWSQLTYDTIHTEAVSLNTYSPPLPRSELQSIARSAHGFMTDSWWGNRSNLPGCSGTGSPRSRIQSWHREELTKEESRRRCQLGAAQTAAAKTKATRSIISHAADRIRATGQQPTKRAVATITGLSESTVKRHADLYR